MEVLEEDLDILIVTNNGYGKRTPAENIEFKTEAVKELKHVISQIKMVVLYQ